MLRKKSILYIFIVVFALAVFICQSAPLSFAEKLKFKQNTIVLTEKDNNSSISLTEGNILIVKLPYTSGTGYNWEIKNNDSNLLEPEGEPVFELVHKDMPGSSGRQIFKFKANLEGDIVLVLVYRRGWEKNIPPAQTFTVNIEIKQRDMKTSYDIISKEINKDVKKYSAQIKYPQIKNLYNKTVEIKFNKEVLKYINKNINKFKQELEDQTQPQRLSWSIFLDYDVKLESINLISILFTGGAFEGGAHPTPEVYTLNYDLKNNKKLSLGDLFKSDSNYLNIVSEYCIDYLLQKEHSDKDWINKGASPSKSNYANFYLTEENLTIVFPPYQVAPYSEGVQEIPISYIYFKESLKEYLIKNRI